MFWWTALVLAQTLECPLEPELRLSPTPVYQALVLKRAKAPKAFDWYQGELRGTAIRLTRRVADGAIGLTVGSAPVVLRPMGLAGLEGQAAFAYGHNGFARSPVAFRIYRADIGFGASQVQIHTASAPMAAARCDGHLALFPLESAGPRAFDANNDGKIDPNSPAEVARSAPAVFELNGRGYRMDVVDWQRRVLTFTEVPLGPKFEEGEVLPDFTYVDRLKESRQLSSHKESYTLIDFWASWCAPCISAFPQLKLLAESHQIRILGINGDEDPGAASRVLAQFEVLWPDVQSTDPAALFDYRYRVALYPTYLLVDPQHKIVLRTESTVELIERVRQIVPRAKIN